MAVNCTQHHIQRWIWSVLIGMQPIFIMLCVQRWSIWCWGARPRRPNRSAQGENPEQIPRIQSKLDAIVHPIAQQIITDINNRKCIKEIGLRCVWMKALFLASTVSAMHRNAFISNASHPLVVTYYCWVTVYSPSMKAKKNIRPTPGIGRWTHVSGNMRLPTLLSMNSKPNGSSLLRSLKSNAEILNCKSQLVLCGKIQLTPKITNHVFTYYLNCTCKSNPVCLIQQWSVIFLLASYVQWHYFLVWSYEN